MKRVLTTFWVVSFVALMVCVGIAHYNPDSSLATSPFVAYGLMAMASSLVVALGYEFVKEINNLERGDN